MGAGALASLGSAVPAAAAAPAFASGLTGGAAPMANAAAASTMAQAAPAATSDLLGGLQSVLGMSQGETGAPRHTGLTSGQPMQQGSLVQRAGDAFGANVSNGQNEELRKQMLSLAQMQGQPAPAPAAPSANFTGPQPGASLTAYLQSLLKGPGA